MSKKIFFFAAFVCLFSILPEVASASVESSLQAVQTKLVGTIIPLAAILGFIYAGFSFITGNPNARNHLVCAMIGAAVAFGATSILSFIHGLVQ